jgi:hypothetical protein
VRFQNPRKRAHLRLHRSPGEQIQLVTSNLKRLKDRSVHISQQLGPFTHLTCLREKLFDLLMELDCCPIMHSEGHYSDLAVEGSRSQNLSHSIEHQSQHSGSNSSLCLGLSHHWHSDSEEETRQRCWIERIDQQHSEFQIETLLGYLVIAKKC